MATSSTSLASSSKARTTVYGSSWSSSTNTSSSKAGVTVNAVAIPSSSPVASSSKVQLPSNEIDDGLPIECVSTLDLSFLLQAGVALENEIWGSDDYDLDRHQMEDEDDDEDEDEDEDDDDEGDEDFDYRWLYPMDDLDLQRQRMQELAKIHYKEEILPPPSSPSDSAMSVDGDDSDIPVTPEERPKLYIKIPARNPHPTAPSSTPSTDLPKLFIRLPARPTLTPSNTASRPTPSPDPPSRSIPSQSVPPTIPPAIAKSGSTGATSMGLLYELANINKGQKKEKTKKIPTDKRKMRTELRKAQNVKNTVAATPRVQSHGNKKRKHNQRPARKAKQTGPSQRAKGFILDAHRPIETAFATKNIPVPRGARSGPTHTQAERTDFNKAHTIEDIKRLRIVEWDGRTPHIIFDDGGKLVAALPGQPNDAGYAADMVGLHEHIVEKAAENGLNIPPKGKKKKTWRGEHRNTSIGKSHGGGQKQPQRISEGVKGRSATAMKEVLRHPGAKRACGYAEASMLNFFGKVHQFYKETIASLNEKCPELKQEEDSSIFSCAAVNWPLHTPWGDDIAWTFKHRDVRNLPFGLCAILALGDFDPTEGGHLILWDLNIAIQFPPGSMILIPSAILLHSNVSVPRGSSRSSMTFYSAGGLFRWVENGGMTDRELRERDPTRWAEMQEKKDGRWTEGYGMWWNREEFLASLKK